MCDVAAVTPKEERCEWIAEIKKRHDLGRWLHPRACAEPGTLERLGPWTRDPTASHCWTRTVEGGDPANLQDRRVFVEKTPRVFDPTLGLLITDCWGWIQGDKGEADDGQGPDLDSRKWADDFAEGIGYVLPEREVKS